MSFFEIMKKLFHIDDILLYTAIGDEDCMRTIGKLRNAGVRYRTKTRGVYGGIGKRSMGFDSKLSQYDIYVNKEDAHAAHVAISGN